MSVMYSRDGITQPEIARDVFGPVTADNDPLLGFFLGGFVSGEMVSKLAGLL